MTNFAAIAARAAYLDERHGAGPVPEGAIAGWLQAVGRGDRAAWEKRLAWDGWDPLALERLAPVEPAELPPWALALAEALELQPLAAPGARLPYEQALAPFAAWAGQPAPGAREALLARLSAVAAPTLQALRGDGGYEAFVQALDWGAVWERFPVLARLMGTAMLQWRTAVTELLERLAADAELLPGGTVLQLTGGLADPHHDGRGVWRVDFAGGHAVYYKPRSLGVDLAFDALLAWLAGHGLPLKRLHVVDRGSHGWVEAAVAAPCADEAAVQRYFQRMGVLLALVYALDGSDFHRENLVAAGEHPVLIDLETLLRPAPEPRQAAHPFADRQTLEGQLVASVLDTQLLTALYQTAGRTDDAGALADPAPGGLQQPDAWLDVNTDAMRRGPAPAPDRLRNLPQLDGRPVSARPYARQVVAGFQACYDLLLRHRDELPLAGFAGQPLRFIFRNTHHYERLLEDALRPEALLDGLARSFSFDVLARTFLARPAAPPLWPLIAAERRQLENMDVPLFQVAAGEAGPFGAAALDAAGARLAGLSVQDRALQTELVRLVLAESGPPRPVPAIEPPLPYALRERLAARAMRLGDGSTQWLSLVDSPRFDRQVPGLLGAGLLGGLFGLALLFAAHHRLEGRDEDRRLALAAVRPLLGLAGPLAPHVGVTGSSGLAGMAYGWAVLGELLDEPALAAEARSAVAAIASAALERCPSCDVAGGLAGTVLALEGVHRRLGDPAALALAEQAAGIIMQRRDPAGGWRSGAQPLAGFAHGAAGIAHAFVRLGWREAAADALAFEATRFDPAAGNWAIPGRASFMTSWCHGAPGVALARLFPPDDDPRWREERELALGTLLAAPPHELDFLCCGNFGRIEVLHEAALALDRPELLAEARERATPRLQELAARDALERWREEDLDLSFLRGAPGVGYAAARLVAPGRLPCILRFE